MPLSVEAIVALYKARETNQGPVMEQMRRVRDLANGDVVIPLNELDRNAKSSVANLLVQGLDQMSMRVASTMPNTYFPPMKEGSERSKSYSRIRRNAMDAMWDFNKMPQKLRRRARHLLGYSMSAVYLKPDFQTLMPKWVIVNPLDTFPAPMDDPDNCVPDDCIFSYRTTANYLMNRYGDAVTSQLRMGRVAADTKYTMLQYVSPDSIQLIVLGAADDPGLNTAERMGTHAMELEYIPNRTGRPLAIVANRITLDKPRGQFDGILGMYYTRARLQALTEIAIERGIFPEEYLVARSGEAPVVVQVADGRKGKLGIVKGGDMIQHQLNPGYKTDQALDRLERQERLEGAIPAEFGGESSTNVRTGRRGENILSSTVDFRIQEAQETFANSLLEENKAAIAIERFYWGDVSKSFYIPGRTGGSESSYVPNKIWESDMHYVAYSSAGSDVNALVVGLGQRLGAGIMSLESAREIDPLIDDPEVEHDRLIGEGLEAALMASLEQQAVAGTLPAEDMAYITMLVKERDVTIYDAVARAQQRAQDRQAAMAPAGDPMTQPGLSMPGMGMEAGAAPAPGGLDQLLASLGGA